MTIELAFNDTLDSREIDERIEELEALTDRTENEQYELEVLRDFCEKICRESAGGQDDWNCGFTFIRDSYFVEYTQDLAQDIAERSNPVQWPSTCIDWEQAARELRMDYMSVELDSVTYWYL